MKKVTIVVYCEDDRSIDLLTNLCNETTRNGAEVASCTIRKLEEHEQPKSARYRRAPGTVSVATSGPLADMYYETQFYGGGKLSAPAEMYLSAPSDEGRLDLRNMGDHGPLLDRGEEWPSPMRTTLRGAVRGQACQECRNRAAMPGLTFCEHCGS